MHKRRPRPRSRVIRSPSRSARAPALVAPPDVTRARPFGEASLRSLFRRLIDTSLVSSLALASACGSPVQVAPDTRETLDAGSQMPGRSDGGAPQALPSPDDVAWPDAPGLGFVDVVCNRLELSADPETLHPSETIDSLAVRLLVWLSAAPAADHLWQQAGSPCASTADGFRCQTELATLVSQLEGACTAAGADGPPACDVKLVTTGPSGPKAWDKQTQLLALLGSVDTPQEALWVAQESALAQSYSACVSQRIGAARPVQGGYQVVLSSSDGLCGAPIQSRNLFFVSTSGEVRLITHDGAALPTHCGTGRRPEGLTSHAAAAGESALGDFLANCAHLEAASIDAFETLADELAHHDAPAALVALARACATDEVRHAQSMSQLAKTHCGTPRTPVVAHGATRSLEAIATHNAVEGCVSETYGALVATYQSEHATDPQLAAALAEIAADETRHASFSWTLAQWLATRLGPEAQARVSRARSRAWNDLRRSLSAALDPSLYTSAGMPRPEVALALCAGLEEWMA